MAIKKYIIPKEFYITKIGDTKVILTNNLELQCADCLHMLVIKKIDKDDGTFDFVLIKDCFCTGKTYK